MTKDDILNMPAGREMDKLIQSFVMGGLPPVRMDWIMSYIPNYSTEIAVAWEVVEKLRKQFHYRVYSDVTKIGQCHTANFYNNAVGVGARKYYLASADTAPLAICRAALLAVMGNKNA